MKIKDLLKAAASTALDVFAPGARQVINAVLPPGKQLADTATGAEAEHALQWASPEDKAQLLESELQLAKAQEEGWTTRYQAMCQADGQSSRARIALLMAWVMALEILAFTVWAFVYPETMTGPGLWTVFATLTGVPAGLLGKYFGELRREQHRRHESMGAPALPGLWTRITKALK